MSLPTIYLNGKHLREVTANAVTALEKANDPPKLFARDGALVRIQRTGSRFLLQEVGPVQMRNELSHAADWVTEVRGKKTRTGPPLDLAVNVLAERDLSNRFLRLSGLASVPFMTSTGRIVDKPGYNPQSGWFLTTDDDDDWSDHPEGGAHAAAWVLDELFGDFRFADESSRAHALALFLLPFVRAAIDGPTPMHFVDAPSPGSGKGLLVTAALLPGLGYPVAATPLPTDENEVAKLLFALLKQGAPAIMFDNVKAQVKSPSLEACLTATVYNARVLQASVAPEVQVRSVFALTANNGRFSGDGARRCLWIRLDTGEEDPEKRTGFRHPSLLDWAGENSVELVAAALAMCRAWVDAGMPKGKRLKGSYERWAGVVGGILEVCGVAGFLANDKDLKRATSDDDEAWRGFYAEWWKAFRDERVPVKELRALAERLDLLDFVFAKAGTEKARATAFGIALGARHHRVLDGLSPERQEGMTHGLTIYRLRSKDPKQPEGQGELCASEEF